MYNSSLIYKQKCSRLTFKKYWCSVLKATSTAKSILVGRFWECAWFNRCYSQKANECRLYSIYIYGLESEFPHGKCFPAGFFIMSFLNANICTAFAITPRANIAYSTLSHIYKRNVFNKVPVPDHDGGRPMEVNACILITHMVYL